MDDLEKYIVGNKHFREERKPPPGITKRAVLTEWLDENLNSIDPGTDEIAMVIVGKLLVEHSCCDTQTFQICDELYDKFVNAE